MICSLFILFLRGGFHGLKTMCHSLQHSENDHHIFFGGSNELIQMLDLERNIVVQEAWLILFCPFLTLDSIIRTHRSTCTWSTLVCRDCGRFTTTFYPFHYRDMKANLFLLIRDQIESISNLLVILNQSLMSP